MDIQFIKQFAKYYHYDMIAFAQRLIQSPSISGDEKKVADLYVSEMKKLDYDEVFVDEAGNVVGIINGTVEGPSIMYNSHLDHVSPGDIINWENYDPYGGEIDICHIDSQDKSYQEQTDCIHGRAASDTKGGGAVQIYAGAILAHLKRQGLGFPGKFIFTGVVIEEPAEMAGMIYLLDKTFPQKKLTYDAMITSEASSLNLYCGHRGRVELLVTVYGRTSHGSAPWLGINAIYKAYKFLDMLQNNLDYKLPTDPELGKSTITTTIISCSPGALSIVPDKCFLTLDRRLIPGETIEEAVTQIEDIISSLSKADSEFKADVRINSAVETTYTGIDIETEKSMAPWKIDKNHPIVKAASEALYEIGQTPQYGYWDFATDASKTAGIDYKPTIGYSPMQEQYAHTPYDKVRIDFMDKALEGNVAIFLNLSQCSIDDFNR